MKNFYPVHANKTLSRQYNNTEENISFTLIAFIVHHGGQDGNQGHYICYFKENQQWFLANDDSPFEVLANIDEVLQSRAVCEGIHTALYQQQHTL